MPVTVTKTTIKPDNVLFFIDSNPENASESISLRDWAETLPGFVSHSVSLPNVNTRITTTVWDSVENYVNAEALRSARPELLAKRTYKTMNNIQTTVEEHIT